MTMLSTLALLLGVFALLRYLPELLRPKRRLVRGPQRRSWLFGNEEDIFCQEVAGTTEAKWYEHYGGVVSIGGCFGREDLLITDPKALHHVFHTGGYNYPKPADTVHIFYTMFGNGVATVNGEVHRRQRRVLAPAFGAAQIARFVPIFQTSCAKLCDSLAHHLNNSSKIVNILDWSGNITLDNMGLAFFGQDFGAIDNKPNPMNAEMNEIFGKTLARTPPGALIYLALWRNLPAVVMNALVVVLEKLTPFGVLTQFREHGRQFSAELIKKSLEEGNAFEKKDLVSILAASQISKDENKQLTPDEVLCQMTTMLVAGKDTTSFTLCGLLYQLAAHPEHQRRLRDEVTTWMAANPNPSPTDYDNDLPYLNACLKEALRLHGNGHVLIRTCTQDDVLPLLEPIRLVNGHLTTGIPIKKGQNIYCSAIQYHKLKSLWGDDAEEWNPDRFLKDLDQPVNLGIFANLLAFSGGTKGCIGWRFAYLEMQVIISTLVQKFDFETAGEITYGVAANALITLIRGREHEGVQLPLKVTVHDS